MKEYRFKINGNEYNVAINSLAGNIADVTVNGASYKVEMENVPAAAPVQTAPAAPVQNTPAPTAAPAPAAPKPAPAAASGAGKKVTAPLPGVIIGISVKEGDTVKAGQQVAVLEAMKMENAIEATADGTVTAIHVNTGDSVLEGAAIVTIA
jgi:methylmalonyl-coA decarboxylase, gamma subunit